MKLNSIYAPWRKLNYKSFIRQTSSVCILFHPFNARHILSPTTWLHDLRFLQEKVRWRQFAQSHFSCPWQPMDLAWLSSPDLSSFHSSSSFFCSWGSSAFVKSPPPFVTNPTTLSMSNPLATAWGSQYGANRFPAFSVQVGELETTGYTRGRNI